MHGSFCWYELMTTDMEAAESFYRSVVGWNARDAGYPQMKYTLFETGGEPVAGLMTLPQDALDQGGRPGWVGYVEVDDVDASAAKVIELGGKLHVPPTDIPAVGRFAMAADPHGAVIVLFKPSPQMQSAAKGAGWHELMADGGAEAFDFYSKLFGWTKGEGMDMGPMGVYQLFQQGGVDIGGMMTRPAGVPQAYWTYYFPVPSIPGAVKKIEAGGGTVINGPMEVPGGDWIVQGLDPQGAVFSLLGANS